MIKISCFGERVESSKYHVSERELKYHDLERECERGLLTVTEKKKSQAHIHVEEGRVRVGFERGNNLFQSRRFGQLDRNGFCVAINHVHAVARRGDL